MPTTTTPAAAPAPAPAAAAAKPAKPEPPWQLQAPTRVMHPDSPFGWGPNPIEGSPEYEVRQTRKTENHSPQSLWDSLIVSTTFLNGPPPARGSTAPDKRKPLPPDIFLFTDVPVTIGGDLAFNWDVTTTLGGDGAWEVFKGYTPAKPKVSWTIWNEAQFQVYQNMMAKIRPRPGRSWNTPMGNPPKLTVSHPLLAMHSLYDFNLMGVTLLAPKGKGLFDVSLSLVEWFTSPKMRPHTDDKKMRAAIEKQGAGDEAPIPPGRGQR